jgi:hypothetical protein
MIHSFTPELTSPTRRISLADEPLPVITRPPRLECPYSHGVSWTWVMLAFALGLLVSAIR